MVYLLHLTQPFKHARHYIGYCKDGTLPARLQRHRVGKGAAFLRAAIENGIDFVVARTWDGEGREFERKLKNQKHSRRHCPCCREMKEQSATAEAAMG